MPFVLKCCKIPCVACTQALDCSILQSSQRSSLKLPPSSHRLTALFQRHIHPHTVREPSHTHRRRARLNRFAYPHPPAPPSAAYSRKLPQLRPTCTLTIKGTASGVAPSIAERIELTASARAHSRHSKRSSSWICAWTEGGGRLIKEELVADLQAISVLGQ